METIGVIETQTEPGAGAWTAPQCPFRIEYEPRVLDDIRLAVVDAFFSLPRGGTEIGGVLLGTFEDGRLLISDYRPLECEHAFGPSFTLSPDDEARLRDILAGECAGRNGAVPVGWYHSHTRSDIFLSETDQDIHRRYFTEAWQVALVLKPHTFQPARAGFFFREPDGSLHASGSYQEFVLEPLPVRPLPPAAPPSLENGPVPIRNEAEPQGPVITIVAETPESAVPPLDPAVPSVPDAAAAVDFPSPAVSPTRCAVVDAMAPAGAEALVPPVPGAVEDPAQPGEEGSFEKPTETASGDAAVAPEAASEERPAELSEPEAIPQQAAFEEPAGAAVPAEPAAELQLAEEARTEAPACEELAARAEEMPGSPEPEAVPQQAAFEETAPVSEPLVEEFATTEEAITAETPQQPESGPETGDPETRFGSLITLLPPAEESQPAETVPAEPVRITASADEVPGEAPPQQLAEIIVLAPPGGTHLEQSPQPAEATEPATVQTADALPAAPSFEPPPAAVAPGVPEHTEPPATVTPEPAPQPAKGPVTPLPELVQPRTGRPSRLWTWPKILMAVAAGLFLGGVFQYRHALLPSVKASSDASAQVVRKPSPIRRATPAAAKPAPAPAPPAAEPAAQQSAPSPAALQRVETITKQRDDLAKQLDVLTRDRASLAKRLEATGAENLKLRADVAAEAARARKLDQAMQDLRKQLATQQRRRLENQSGDAIR